MCLCQPVQVGTMVDEQGKSDGVVRVMIRAVMKISKM
jgi:hypothetical protein